MKQPPEPTELIHLPRRSWLPALVALGVAMAVAGLFSWWPYTAAGALIALLSIAAWMRQVGADVGALPRQQQTSTAPVPLIPSRRREG